VKGELKPLSIPSRAKQLGLGTATVWRAIYDGKMPYHKCGRRTLITDRDLDSYLASCAVPARATK